MKGMEISRAYFDMFGEKMLKDRFYDYTSVVAAGLVGEGSECFGYDDQYSRDHDFGPGFCIWLPEDIYEVIGEEMQTAYETLPRDFKGFTRISNVKGGRRRGVFSIGDFYIKYTGLKDGPVDNMEWLCIPEHFLATATNGHVFMDNKGRFTEIRQRLLKFYPRDVLYKKLAARMATMAQSGQYNYPRTMKRKELQAGYLACSEFIKAAISAIFLLNGVYMPFYKWVFRRTEELTQLRGSVVDLKELALISDTPENFKKKCELIERICFDIATELNRRGMIKSYPGFLVESGEELMSQIEDNRIARLNIFYDCR